MTTLPKSENEFQSLPLKLGYSYLADAGLGAEASQIKASSDRLGAYTSSLRRAKIVALLRDKSLLEKFVQSHWKYALTEPGKKKLKWYDQIYAKFMKTLGSASDSKADSNEDDSEVSAKFVFETQLRDYLAENLGILEAGLSLWPVENGDAVEFHVDDLGVSHRVDILAKDSGGLPVVIELKVSRGHEKTVGQVLYYRAKIRQKFAAKRVRIFIVAAEISPQLRAAASEVPDVLLFEYSLAVKVSQVVVSTTFDPQS